MDIFLKVISIIKDINEIIFIIGLFSSCYDFLVEGLFFYKWFFYINRFICYFGEEFF